MHSNSLDRKIVSFSITPVALFSSYLIAKQVIATFQASMASWIIASILVVGTFSLCVIYIVLSFRKEKDHAGSETEISLKNNQDKPETINNMDAPVCAAPRPDVQSSSVIKPIIQSQKPSYKDTSERKPRQSITNDSSISFPSMPNHVQNNMPAQEVDSEPAIPGFANESRMQRQRISPAEIEELRRQAKERLSSHPSHRSEDSSQGSSISIPIQRKSSSGENKSA